MATDFLDLPIEILPIIIQFLVQPQHLALTCLVSKAFYRFSVEKLYQHAFVYAWHKNRYLRAIRLFRTLASCPHLAKHVEQLTIRALPIAFQSESDERDEILNVCTQGIQNCVNLRSCTWTRDGSLSTDILLALQRCTQLRELEINGHNQGYYHPTTLLLFTALEKISLIMPSSPVISVLPQWVSVSNNLKQLTLICRSSPLVNDTLFQEIAPNLGGLERLYLIGCPKLTHEGLWAVISANRKGLLALGLEGVSPMFDMEQFSTRCKILKCLNRLRSITLTVDMQTSIRSWTDHVTSLLSSSPLEMFHISTLGGDVGHQLGDDFCASIVDVHGCRLKRFSVHRIRMSKEAVNDVCRRCVKLEQLFVVLEQDVLDDLGSCLSHAANLRSVHINRPLTSQSEEEPIASEESILPVVRNAGTNLHHIGINTRVWQIHRKVFRQDDGELGIELQLGPYEGVEIPEQFQVVRL